MPKRFRFPWRSNKPERDAPAVAPPKLAPTPIVGPYNPIRSEQNVIEQIIDSFVASMEGVRLHTRRLAIRPGDFKSVYRNKELPDRLRPRHVPLLRLRMACEALEQPAALLIAEFEPNKLTGDRLGPALRQFMPWDGDDYSDLKRPYVPHDAWSDPSGGDSLHPKNLARNGSRP